MKSYNELLKENTELKEKVHIFYELMHDLQMYRFCCKHEKIGAIIDKMCNWSYAHRVGNGMYSAEEQQAIVDKAFESLKTSLNDLRKA